MDSPKEERLNTMSTGREMMMRASAVKPQLDAIDQRMQDLHRSISDKIMKDLFGREVGAQRARKLRRRGADVRFKCRTSTGKCRYTWTAGLPRIVVEQVDMGPNTLAVRTWYEPAPSPFAPIPLNAIDVMRARTKAAGLKPVPRTG